MRRLHTKVNLIPIIAKADTLTDEEVTEFKERVWQRGFMFILFLSYLFLLDFGRYCLPQYSHLPSTYL